MGLWPLDSTKMQGRTGPSKCYTARIDGVCEGGVPAKSEEAEEKLRPLVVEEVLEELYEPVSEHMFHYYVECEDSQSQMDPDLEVIASDLDVVSSQTPPSSRKQVHAGRSGEPSSSITTFLTLPSITAPDRQRRSEDDEARIDYSKSIIMTSKTCSIARAEKPEEGQREQSKRIEEGGGNAESSQTSSRG